MTDLQKKEIELLKLLIEVCNKFNLTYYLVCGSALGAVKYSGFIPWDDDIDVALPRKDYEIFLDVAQKHLPSWCFLQNYRTEFQFHLLGTKLRDSRTTYVEKSCERLNINHGVFIDVFPLDGKWESAKDQRKFNKLKKIFEGRRRVNLNYNRLSRPGIWDIRTNYYYLMNRLFGLYSETRTSISNYDRFISMYSTETSSVWCNHANSPSELEYVPKEQYGEGIWVEFEGLKVRIPEKFDEYLTQKYGDWRADLPLEQQVGHHYYEVMDLERPYTDYIGNSSKVKKK